MRKLVSIFFVLLLSITAYSNEINEKYSQKDFTNHSFKNIPASEFDNTTITGSCFYQENNSNTPVLFDIFPENVTGLVFIACNLDNVKIPTGAILQGDLNCNRQFILTDSGDIEVGQ